MDLGPPNPRGCLPGTTIIYSHSLLLELFRFMILSGTNINESILTDFCQVNSINIDICCESLKIVKKNIITLLNIMFEGQNVWNKMWTIWKYLWLLIALCLQKYIKPIGLKIFWSYIHADEYVREIANLSLSYLLRLIMLGYAVGKVLQPVAFK